jgi:three-Cys-motif partner protein
MVVGSLLDIDCHPEPVYSPHVRRGTKDLTMHHRFGGAWTTAKLDVLAKYLRAYTTALKDKPTKDRPFRKAYIDAFAGTGYRDAPRRDEPTLPLFMPDLADRESQEVLDGSARLALKTQPRFDKYIFIDRSPQRCAQLEQLRMEFPDVAGDVEIRNGEANDEIRRFCRPPWKSHRAVLFLDPYGMQVEWSTIEAVARTKAIDLWLLFPLGIGVNRLLKKSGDIPPPWRRRLNLLLGREGWYDEFYKVIRTRDLFGNESDLFEKATMQTIGRYFNERLKEVFAGVVDEPGMLRNSVNSPLYLLCFAVGNEQGKEIALRIAAHLLKGLR